MDLYLLEKLMQRLRRRVWRPFQANTTRETMPPLKVFARAETPSLPVSSKGGRIYRYLNYRLCLWHLPRYHLFRMEAINNEPRIEPATIEDLPQLVELLVALFSEEEDFQPNQSKQEHGLRLILEQPNRGRIFVLRTDHMILGMINLLFTISTAEGGLVILLEDLIIHPQHRRQGYGGRLLERAIEFAQEKRFRRLTLLTDRISAHSQSFFQQHGFQFSKMIPMRRVLTDP